MIICNTITNTVKIVVYKLYDVYHLYGGYTFYIICI